MTCNNCGMYDASGIGMVIVQRTSGPEQLCFGCVLTAIVAALDMGIGANIPASLAALGRKIEEQTL